MFESLEARRLLTADPGFGTTPLVISETAFESESVLVRYHAGVPGNAISDPSSGDTATGQAYDSVPGLYELQTPDGLNALDAVAFYANHPGVIYAEPNYVVSLAATPNDADYADLWGMNNTGQTGGTADADIDAAEAWEITTGDRNTIVAVVDTGVDFLHPDLAANMWENPDEIPGDGIDNDGNGFIDDVHGYNFVSRNGNPMDDHDHGTHVAGTIGAVANNGIGVAGVSWDVQIMAVKFLDARGGGSTANAIAAIEYAVDNGATISNHSWGFNGGYSQALADAIEYARLADHLVVAAAGNGGGDRIGDDNDSLPFYPGNFPHENLISIAATDHNDDLATFSNFGRTQVDFGAPGVAILSTTRSGTYSTFSGTSMATPHAAGVAALLRSEYPDWTFDKVRDRLFDTVDPLASLDQVTTTGGRLNAAAAVAIDTEGPIVVDQSPSGEVMRAQDSIQVVFNERVEASSFTTDDIVALTGPSGAIPATGINPVPGTSGRVFEVTFPNQAALGDYQLTVGPDIEDFFGNTMQSSGGAATLSFTIIPDTVGPVITGVMPEQATDQPTDRVRVIFDEAIDPASFTASNISNFVGPGGAVSVTGVEAIAPNEFDISFPMQDAQGSYSLTISGSIQDIAGNVLDQDQDGVQGEAIDDSLDVTFNIQRWLYADSVIDFSSQYTTTVWSAAQALGQPDTFSYGDIETAWAPRSENGTTEFLTLGFAEPLLASGVVIRQTFGNGFVRAIEVRDESTGQFQLISEPTDGSQPGSPVNFSVTWPQTTFGVDAVRITIDTDHDLNAFEEIDSVQLRGVSVPDLDGARVLETSVAGSVEGPIDRIELTFDEPLADGTFTIEDVSQLSGPDGDLTISGVNRLTSTRYEIFFPPQTTFGDYSLSIGPDVLDLQGLPMNQDRDGVNGESVEDAFPIAFRIEQWQFADHVIEFSSQFGTDSWSAAQALGPSDSPNYGDQRTAWAPANMNGTTEFLSVGFAEPILSSGVMVRQTFGNGFVRSIQLRDEQTGAWTTMSIPADDSVPGQPVEYAATWPLTDFAADAVRVEIDTDQTSNFEEIDSIQLRGVPAPDLVGPSVIQSTPTAGHPGPLNEIDLIFSEAIQDGTFTIDDVESFTGPAGAIPVTAVESIAADHYRLQFDQQDARGTYSLVLGTEILDESDNAMDQPFGLTFDIELWQYASSVIDFSSQYSATSWSAEQALGSPDTPVYGDARTAWAPSAINGTNETLTVGFDTAVQSSGVIIRQTFGNGFVRTVEARNTETGDFVVMSTADDDSEPGTPVDYLVTWPLTDFTVDAIRVTIDTDHSSSFEEIDAITLMGVVPPDLTGPRVVATTPQQGSPGPVDHVLITFDEPIDESTFDLSDVSDLNTPSGVVAIDSITPVTDRQFQVNFVSQSEWGNYTLTIGPDISDLSGNLMDQDDDAFQLVFDLELWQDASSVVDFSSQYSATSWSAEQALGAANVLSYGDSRDAWAPSVANGGIETITLGFDTPVLSTGAVIRQTFGNGFVRQVDVRDAETGQFTTMFDGIDDSLPGLPVDFLVSWSMTSFSVDALRIYVDTTHSFSYEEIDSVQLRGVVAPDVTGPRVVATDPSVGASPPVDHIDVTFSEPIDPASLDVADVGSLTGPSGPISVTTVSALSVDSIRIEFAPQTDFGTYQLIVGPGITDLSGNPMNQDADGINGEPLQDAFTGQFDVQLLQYASTVVDFSSQYSPFGWSASDALGAPDTFAYGDARTAWAPRYANAGLETLTVGFQTPVLSTGATIRQTFGNGFVQIVELRDAATGAFHTMPIGPDDSQPGTPVDFNVSWPQTTFAADAIRITIDTAHTFGYEEIDAVALRGVTP